MNFEESMKKYHGQMESALYAAEQVCQGPQSNQSCTLLDVPFECPMRDYNATCIMPKMRSILGDHIDQHDIIIPEDNTQEQRKMMR